MIAATAILRVASSTALVNGEWTNILPRGRRTMPVLVSRQEVDARKRTLCTTQLANALLDRTKHSGGAHFSRIFVVHDNSSVLYFPYTAVYPTGWSATGFYLWFSLVRTWRKCFSLCEYFHQCRIGCAALMGVCPVGLNPSEFAHWYVGFLWGSSFLQQQSDEVSLKIAQRDKMILFFRLPRCSARLVQQCWRGLS